MATRGEEAMMSVMKLVYKAVAVVVANNGQGLIKIDDST